MTAEAGLPFRYVQELRAVQASQLKPLLEEETRNWRARLHWDFTSSAELVTKYVNMRALEGLALIAGAEVAGYCYWVVEEHKALIGDLYVREKWRSAESESQLLNEAYSLLSRPGALRAMGIRRVESQLMQLGSMEALTFPEEHAPVRYARLFMLAPLDRTARFRALAPDAATELRAWDPAYMDGTAELITASYDRHVDSLLNDQYCSVSGATRFLRNIINFPGCGEFDRHASFVAVNAAGDVLGCVVATRIAAGTGHIAQLCTAREQFGRGLGYELLRRALVALERAGCREVSLTVTASNLRARRLYDRMGFREIHRFQALIWPEL